MVYDVVGKYTFKVVSDGIYDDLYHSFSDELPELFDEIQKFIHTIHREREDFREDLDEGERVEEVSVRGLKWDFDPHYNLYTSEEINDLGIDHIKIFRVF